jgi:KDO2-lipid IV(A) lauroyltransferase
MARRELPLVQSIPLWLAVHGAGIAVAVLPRKLELLLGKWLGRLVLLVDRKRRRIAEENLERCLPEKSLEARTTILRKNYEHWGTIFFELLHIFTPIPGHYRRYAKKNLVLEGYEHWKKVHDRGKGVLFASCHVGSWEFLVASGGLNDLHLTMVTRRLTPAWLHRRIENRRLSIDVKAVYQPRTLPVVLKALRNNESVGFVIDQYAAPDTGGVKVRFFGYLVNTLAAIGPIANKTGAGVCPASTYRDSEGIVHVVIEPELDFGSAAGDPVKTTQILAHKVEDWIRAHPEQWLWGHRRFKEADLSDYEPREGLKT